MELQQFFQSLHSLVGANGKVYIAQESMCVLRMSQEKPIEPEERGREVGPTRIKGTDKLGQVSGD